MVVLEEALGLLLLWGLVQHNNPTKFCLPCSLSRSEGKEKRLLGLPAEPPTRGCHMHFHWAYPGMALEHQHNFCPLSHSSHGLMQKPGFLQVETLTHLQGFGDKDQSAEVPLMGLSRERRLLTCQQAPPQECGPFAAAHHQLLKI